MERASLCKIFQDWILLVERRKGRKTLRQSRSVAHFILIHSVNRAGVSFLALWKFARLSPFLETRPPFPAFKCLMLSFEESSSWWVRGAGFCSSAKLDAYLNAVHFFGSDCVLFFPEPSRFFKISRDPSGTSADWMIGLGKHGKRGQLYFHFRKFDWYILINSRSYGL